MHKQCPPRSAVLPQRLSHVRWAAFNAQAPRAAGTLPPSPSPRRSYERPSHQCKGAPARGFPHKEIFDGQCIKRFSPLTYRIQFNRNGIFFSNGRKVFQVHVPLLRRRQRGRQHRVQRRPQRLDQARGKVNSPDIVPGDFSDTILVNVTVNSVFYFFSEKCCRLSSPLSNSHWLTTFCTVSEIIPLIN